MQGCIQNWFQNKAMNVLLKLADYSNSVLPASLGFIQCTLYM